MIITCLHTADVHVATFSKLFEKAGEVDVRHHVAAELLAQAQTGPLSRLQGQVDALVAGLSDADLILCTCSTLGPLVDDLPNVMRVDVPAMQAALDLGPDICVAICLESTRAATLDLLASTARKSGQNAAPRLVLCAEAWPHFEAGDLSAFAETIAARLREEVTQNGAPDCILLAQASMREAAPLVSDLAPVLTTPERAVDAALTRVRA